MYLVTGATGNVGSEVAAALAAAGEEVRALVRDPVKAQVPAGVTAVAGDLQRPETLAAPLEGVEGLFVLPGYDGVLEQAVAAGVGRVVLLSGSSAASGDRSNAVTRYMVESEDALRESGLPATVVRPFAFASNALRWLPQLTEGDEVRETYAAVASAVVDPADIGAVAAAALRSDTHRGRTYTVTGPEPLTPGERLAVLGEVLGRNLRLVPLEGDEAREYMSRTMPPEYVAAFADFYEAGSLDESTPTTDVEQVLGHPPETFRRWAEAHVDAFKA